MSAAVRNIFLDQKRRQEERSPATHVKHFGGTKPLDINNNNNSIQDLGVSNSSRAQSPDGLNRCVNSQRESPSTRSLASTIPPLVSQINYSRKDKRLLALLPPKEEEEEIITRPKRQSMFENNFHIDIENSVDTGDDIDDINNIEMQNGSISQQGPVIQPLEERLCLEDLRRLMSFFAVKNNNNNNNNNNNLVQCTTEVSLSDNSYESKTSFNKSNINPSRISSGESKEVSGNNQSTKSRQSKAYSSSGGDEPLIRKNTEKSIRSRDGTCFKINTKEDLQKVLLSSDITATTTATNQLTESEIYTRVLTEEEFAMAVKAVVPGVTDIEIMELMKKVDYEAKGKTTWDDFATFLVSQGRQRSHLVQGTIAELSTTPEPSNCISSLQHVSGTCMEADSRRKLLLTGGSEGTVRAWNLNTLESCGVVFAGDCWVIGVHWANQMQSILIVTMDRKVIILDSKTLEVKRLYRGRAVVDSADGYMYAHDSVECVKVGGKIKHKVRRYGVNGVGSGNTNSSNNNNNNNNGIFKGQQGLSPTNNSNNKKKINTAISSSLPLPTLAAPGTGPYVQCSVEECMLAGLVDAVSCSLFHHSALREDMIILGTVIGEVRFYIIPKTARRVISPHAVLRLHEKRINKMSIMFDTSSLLTASNDGTVKMTSLETGILLKIFCTSGSEQHSAVHDFAIHSQQRLLITVGPERYGIVWDFSHDVPMAILDSHNSPCRSCAVHAKKSQIFTSGTDGTIFIFDIQGYRLMQVLHVHHLNPQRILYDEPRHRLLCLASHPYFHSQQRHAVSACSSKYEGHMAPMVGVMYNKTYDIIVTIDSEGLVMTWRRINGAPVFAFQLKDFSDSAVMNTARLTSFTLDGLERRLLTGFHNGAVAIWNLVNGQTTNVITAATEGSMASIIKPEVTALGSLMRDGITFFIFAASGCLFSTRESNTFTIASATKWEVPERYGEVLAMLPISMQILVCGTSSGALIFYHVLAERQVGSPLWVVDSPEPIRRSLHSSSLDRLRSHSHGAVLTSRIIKIFPLHDVSTHILMSVHGDGTVALWHTLRRLLMESVSVRSAFPTIGEETGLSHVAIDNNNQHFIFADDRGNIHVCNMKFRAMPDAGSMKPARLTHLKEREGKESVHWPGSPFDNPVFKDVLGNNGKIKQGGVNINPSSKSLHEQEGEEDEQIVDKEKTPYVFAEFCRDYVFHSGLPSISGVSIVDSANPDGVPTLMKETKKKTTPKIVAVDRKDGKEETLNNSNSISNNNSNSNSKTGIIGEMGSKINKGSKHKRPSTAFSSGTVPFAFAQPLAYDGVIVVSSATDNFTRVFTLDGTIIGECGMNTWTVGKTSTYEFLGSKPTRRLPPHYCNIGVIDFLEETSQTDKNIILSTRRNRQIRGGIRGSNKNNNNNNMMDISSTTTHDPIIAPHFAKSITDPSAIFHPQMSSISQEVIHGERSFTQLLGAELLDRVENHHQTNEEDKKLVYQQQQEQQQQQSHQQEQQKQQQQLQNQREGKTRFLPISKSPQLDEVGTLSTHIRSRRSRDTLFQGLVKSEFIPKLRGLPIMETDDETPSLEVTTSIVNNVRGYTRIDQASESSFTHTINNNNNNNNNNNMSNSLIMEGSNPEGVSSALETRSSITPVLVVGSRVSKAPGRKRGSNIGTELDTTRASAMMAGRFSSIHNNTNNNFNNTTHGGGFHNTDNNNNNNNNSNSNNQQQQQQQQHTTVNSTDEDSPFVDIIQGHMELQRRMLLSLGRTDSVLGGLPSTHHLTSNSSSTAGNNNNNNNNNPLLSDTGNYCNRLLASRRNHPSGISEARTRVAQITSRLQIFHVDEIMPPKGTRAREDIDFWDKKMKNTTDTSQ